MSRPIASVTSLVTVTLWSLAALAAPSLQGVSGTVANKGSITIQGAGFGTKSVAAPVRFDTFDSGTSGAGLPSQDSGGWYTETGGGGHLPVFDGAYTRSGTGLSAYQNFTGTGRNHHNSTIALEGLFSGDIYFSGWFYRIISGAPSRNFKWIQLTSAMTPYDTGQQFRMDYHPDINDASIGISDCTENMMNGCDDDVGCSGYTAGNCVKYCGMRMNLYADSNWHRYEVWFHQGTPGVNDGRVEVRIDSQPIETTSQAQGSMSGVFNQGCNNGMQSLWTGIYYADDTGTPEPQMQQWWDEMYVDRTQARVEIGNASTWAACTHREIQVPTTWSSGSITCTVNQGTFPTGQAYLYVVDATGAANAQGYPVTFGGGTDAGPPGQPGQPIIH